MYIKKSLTRQQNRLHADLPNAVHEINSVYTSMNGNSVSVNVQIRAYADVESKNFDPIQDDGRQADESGYSIPYNELSFEQSSNPIEELKRASLAWLIQYQPKYQGGEIVAE